MFKNLASAGQKSLLAALLALNLGDSAAIAQTVAPTLEPPIDNADTPPAITREFRGVWIASVRNIDWPSRPGLPVERQQAELRRLLDTAVSLKLNAVVLQVRPTCDALYASRLEPWSEYLTGRQGQAPEPFYDPLAFAVAEAHARGLELHAWFNPYRVRMLDDGRSPAAPNHISVTKPQLVKRYGKQQWLDPGEPEVQSHSLNVIMDVVKRYDIDAVHMDDYFYPYREAITGPDGKPVNEANGTPRWQPFPDDPSYQKYQAAGGTLGRDDWRRENVNGFIRRLYAAIKQEKPSVKLGISPFGIWKPGHPAQIKGMNQFELIYADAKLWLEKGWVDYFAPQLYWSIENPDQSYPVLLRWWAEQNPFKRHLWPGLFTSRVKESGERAFNARQISYQIQWTRLEAGASGHIHFSMAPLAENVGGLSTTLAKEVYQQPALIPVSPWLPGKKPGKPRLTLSKNLLRGTLSVRFAPEDGDTPWLWALYTRRNGKWTATLQPAGRNEVSLSYGVPDGAEGFEVALVNRAWIEGPHARIQIRHEDDGGPAPLP